MSEVALIRNPASTRNLKAASGTGGRVPAGVRLIESQSVGALSKDLEAGHAAGADLVLIDGGDGTVRDVLSRLPEIWGTALPQIGILPRGNTNLIAREVGGLASSEAVTELLRRRGSGGKLAVRRRALLRIDYPSGEHPPLRGFMLGWGAYATGTRIAHEEIAARGPGQVARAVMATVRRSLIGAERKIMRRGVATGLSIDGKPACEDYLVIGLTTTLQGRLIGGMNPFWGEGEGPIRWLAVQAPGRRAVLAVPLVLMGRPAGWMRRSGYESGRAVRMELELDTPFILDGEEFPPPQSGPMTLTTDEKIDFVSL